MRPEPGARPAQRPGIVDATGRYGLVSRFFHWVMAYLLIWQCLMFVGWRILDEGVMRKAALFGPSHSAAGLLILALVVPRALWAGVHRSHPPRLGRIVRIAHALLYLLMFVIPAIALLRAYGSGKGLVLGTLRLLPATGRELPALTAPADLLHAPLGWALAILIGGHVAMALVHHFVHRDGSLGRMLRG